MIRRDGDRPTSRQLFDELMGAYGEAPSHSAGWAALVARTSLLIDELGRMPPTLLTVVEDLRAEWASGGPDPAALVEGKVALWRFLDTKHGSSTTIADAEDRTARAALTLAEAGCSPDAVSDCAAWVADMLSSDPWPSATSMF